MKTTELPDTNITKHFSAVQDLPANARSPLSAILNSRFSFFLQNLQGMSSVFSRGKLHDLSQPKSLVILSLRYSVYIHHLSNLKALSMRSNYLIRMLRTFDSKLFGDYSRLARESCHRLTLGYGVETVCRLSEKFAIKFFLSLNSVGILIRSRVTI